MKFKILKSKLGDQTVKFEKLAFYLVITTFKLEISTLKFEFERKQNTTWKQYASLNN